MKKTLLRMLMLTMVIALIAACVPTAALTVTSQDFEEPAVEKVLRIGIPGDSGSLDPATGTTAAPQYPIKSVYRGLFSFAADGSLKNEVAEDYEFSEDGLVYTFHLRKDAKWSDGVPVTAKDFVYGFQRNLYPELKAAYADLLSAIVNFDDCMAGNLPMEEFGVEAVDDHTLVVTLSRTQPYFPMMITFSPFFPVREDKVPKDVSTWSVENVKEVVTNGPFMFEEYVPNEKVVLVPNPESYEAANVKLSRLEFYFIPDQQAQVAAFQTGEIDMALNVPMTISSTYPNPEEIKEVPYLVNNIYLFSARQPVFEDIRVREAINLTINREQIAAIQGGLNTPLYALVPPGVTNPATGQDFRAEGGNLITEDVARAKELMAEAGYPNGQGFPEMRWVFNNLQTHADVAQAVAGQLKENLGITLALTSMDNAAFSAARRTGNFDIVRLGTSADYVDPTTWLNLYISNAAYIKRVSGYSTTEYDALMREADSILDPAERFEKLHEAEKMMVESYWWIPISTRNAQMLVKDYVEGVFTSTAGDVFAMFADIVK
jgi:oligopeptide transport system substrate-binding protein